MICKRGLGNCDSSSLYCIIMCAHTQQKHSDNTGNFQLENNGPPFLQFRLNLHMFSIVFEGRYSTNMMNLTKVSRIGYVVILCLCCWHPCLVTMMADMHHCREASILKRSCSSVMLILVSVCSMSEVASLSVGNRKLEIYTIFYLKGRTPSTTTITKKHTCT
jgi:hypothetical protein